MTSRAPDINLKLLRAFDAVAQSRSFSRAAARLGRTQATMSAQVRELEDQLGVRLLDRTTRNVSLTAGGEALSAATSEGFELISAGLIAARNHADDRKNRIVVACVPSLSGARFPAILASYRVRDRVTRIDVEELTSSEILAAIDSGTIDFGIGPCVDPPPPEIQFTAAVDEPLCVVLPKDHPLQGSSVITLAALAALPLITLSGSVLLQTRLEALMRESDLRLSSQTEVRHVQTAVGMVRAGIGAAVVPRLALPNQLEFDIVALPIGEPNFSRAIGIITRRGQPMGRTASRLARHVRSTLVIARRQLAEQESPLTV